MGIFDNLRNSLSKRQAMLGREPNAGNMPQLRPAVMPKIPNMPNLQGINIPNIPNLQGIGGIPGLQNIDFSNLPMGMDFSNFDPRAINANPQGFQDMIRRAQEQEQMMPQAPTGNFTTMRENMPPPQRLNPLPRVGDYRPSMGLNPPPSGFEGSLPIQQGSLPVENSMSMVGTMGGPGYGEYPLGTAGPRVDPSDPNYIPPPTNRPTIQAPPSGFEGSTTMPVRNPDGTTMGSPLLPQAPVMPSQPTTLGGLNPVPMPSQPEQTTAPAQPVAPVQQPLAPYTGGNDPAPYVSNLLRNETGLDALSQQLLFGLDGKGGFIPGAMQAAETSFFNPDGTPRVVEQQVADLTPDQLRSMGMAREATGIQDPYLQDAVSSYRSGRGELDTGLDRARARELESLGAITGGVGSLGGRLSESENLLRGTLGGYDQSLTSQFYNPYEDRVVQQTIDDVFKAGEKQDMAQRARDIQTGGESAFGSRARLSAQERREALGRGLGQSLGSLRAQGFGEAQRTGLGEFARQRAQEMATSQGLSGLAGTRFGAQQTQAGALSNLGSLEGTIGQQRAQAQQNLGANLQNIGTQAQQASAFDINQLMGTGQTQQQQQQAQLEAQRMNQLQAQQAPMAQYQSLLPFMQSVPTGSFQTSTTFAPKPSALQSGLGVGLSTLGAMGNFFNQPQQRPYAGYKI